MLIGGFIRIFVLPIDFWLVLLVQYKELETGIEKLKSEFRN